MRPKWLSCLLLPLALFCWSCGQSGDAANTSGEQKDFYPVMSFIREELALLDSLPVAVSLYRESEGKSDTSILDKAAFRRIAEALGEPDISRDPLRKGYKETVYMDATMNLITMSYRPTDASATVIKTDVYIDPATEKVKSIYIEKRFSEANSTVVQKIVWSAGRQLQLTSIVSITGQAERVIQERYHWGMP
jgi:hypothetical protein